MALFILFFASAFAGAGASAAQLPSVHAASADTKAIQAHAKWWAHVGDRMYYAPPASFTQLSHNLSNYYYGLGSDTALTTEMRKHRVGGEGRWHIFHLPQGPSMLQIQSCGDRREAFSSLAQLRHGEVLGSFPEYKTFESYSYPGAQATETQEVDVAKSISADAWEKYLVDIISIPGGVDDTRSYTNPKATKQIQDYLVEQFKSMGMQTCKQEWQQDSGVELANVVAVIPGTSTDTLTLGAHYDSRPFEGRAPGAEDNGSGVATLLTIAKAFTSAGIQPKRTLYFVGFAAEEPGLIGSKEFALGLKGKGTPIKCKPASSFMQAFPSWNTVMNWAGRSNQTSQPQVEHAAIVLDEVGWPSPALTKKTVNLESQDWTKPVMDHLAQSNLLHNGKDMFVIHNNKPFGSDHMSFLDNDMPGVLVINGDDDKYPEYHKSGDQYFTKPEDASKNIVKKEYAAQIARMVLGGVMRVGGVRPGAAHTAAIQH